MWVGLWHVFSKVIWKAASVIEWDTCYEEWLLGKISTDCVILFWGKALKHHSAGAMSENAHHVAYMTNSHLYWHSYIVYLFLVAIFHCLTTVSKLSLGARCACMYPKFPEWYRRFYSKRALSNQIECVTRMVPCVMSPGFFLAFFHSFCLIIVFLFCFFSSNSQLWSLVGAFSAFRSMDLERLWFLTSLMRSLSE